MLLFIVRDLLKTVGTLGNSIIPQQEIIIYYINFANKYHKSVKWPIQVITLILFEIWRPLSLSELTPY